MAFKPNDNAGNGNNSNSQSNDGWKAQGFLNLYLPSQDGKRRKLGAIPLYEKKANEAKLLEWLNADPSRVALIMAKLIIEYQPATPAEGTGFDLG